MGSIFTKIINKELPCYKIHEDEYTLSFLSTQPIQLGHTLVIPKIEVDHFLDTPEPYYTQIFTNAKFIGKAIQTAANSPRIATSIQGWEVPHCHYHLIPSWGPKDSEFKYAKERMEKEMKDIQQRIISELKLP
ncbi:MAG: HIT family protein [Bdellovibrionales bacterium]|jgi:histidine triad (HIT) family protein|nr:HIT family protein [Bdellovibrionales bacterium]